MFNHEAQHAQIAANIAATKAAVKKAHEEMDAWEKECRKDLEAMYARFDKEAAERDAAFAKASKVSSKSSANQHSNVWFQQEQDRLFNQSMFGW